jgi:prolyl-tRNA synthetase
VRKAVEIYKKVLDRLGVAYLILKRPDFDKFAGAKYSIAFDAWNPMAGSIRSGQSTT